MRSVSAEVHAALGASAAVTREEITDNAFAVCEREGGGGGVHGGRGAHCQRALARAGRCSCCSIQRACMCSLQLPGRVQNHPPTSHPCVHRPLCPTALALPHSHRWRQQQLPTGRVCSRTSWAGGRRVGCWVVGQWGLCAHWLPMLVSPGLQHWWSWPQLDGQASP